MHGRAARAAVLGAALAWGCGEGATTVILLRDVAPAGPDASAPSSPPAEGGGALDAEVEADAEAGDAGEPKIDLCPGPSFREAGDGCFVHDECPTCLGGYRYACPVGKRPSFAGCTDLEQDASPGFGSSYSCCPPACSRYAIGDPEFCGAERFRRRAFACPISRASAPAVMPPEPDCAVSKSDAGTFNSTIAVCCP